MSRKRARLMRPVLDRLNDRCLPSASLLLAPTAGFTPSQVTQAYGLNAITFSSNGQTIQGNGAGQTIAIVDAYHDPNLASDLHTFDQANSLPDPTLTQINQAGTTTNDGWAGEEALDVEWAHAIAPGAQIVVVEAKSDSVANLTTAVSTARTLSGVSVVSMSWGGSETPSETQSDSLFTTPAGHTGITFIASSGDSGAAAGSQWPAASPNVLSVGGTSLQVGTNGAYQAETSWNGSGGGYSQYEPEPTYQQAAQSTGQRSTPDVAFLADPATGVAVYSTVPSSGQGSWQVVGGTSLGAPAWAGIMAIVDQGRATAGLGTLDGATQTLPALYSLPSTDFHNIASASSGLGLSFSFGFFSGFGLGFSFQPQNSSAGANTTTGLGTPAGSSLISDLAFSVHSAGSSGVGSTTTTTGNAPSSPTGSLPNGNGGPTTGGQTGPTNPPSGAPVSGGGSGSGGQAGGQPGSGAGSNPVSGPTGGDPFPWFPFPIEGGTGAGTSGSAPTGNDPDPEPVPIGGHHHHGWHTGWSQSGSGVSTPTNPTTPVGSGQTGQGSHMPVTTQGGLFTWPRLPLPGGFLSSFPFEPIRLTIFGPSSSSPFGTLTIVIRGRGSQLF
jgi:hypothetical protein